MNFTREGYKPLSDNFFNSRPNYKYLRTYISFAVWSRGDQVFATFVDLLLFLLLFAFAYLSTTCAIFAGERTRDVWGKTSILSCLVAWTGLLLFRRAIYSISDKSVEQLRPCMQIWTYVRTDKQTDLPPIANEDPETRSWVNVRTWLDWWRIVVYTHSHARGLKEIKVSKCLLFALLAWPSCLE